MRTIESIKENEVVHCPTEEQAIAFCKLLHEAGYEWKWGKSYEALTHWKEYKEETCYNPTEGTYQNRGWFSDCKITDVSKFLPNDKR